MGANVIENVWPNWVTAEILGEGSFGKVYKATRTERGLTTSAAIKIISIPQSDSELSSLRAEGFDEASSRTYFQGVADDFINEIKMLETLKGTPNIVGVEDFAIQEKPDNIGVSIYIRMELLISFNDYIKDKKFSEQEVIKLGIDILNALELCSQKNIIHRDIKPENIFVSEFGIYKLGDFGIAREMEKTTGNMSQKGTFNYMAPEVAAGKAYDLTVDTYSLGIVLYRLLNNNRLPFLDPHSKSIRYQDRKDSIDRRLSGEALPRPIEASEAMAQIVLKACAFNPLERYRTASEFKQALEDAKAGRPIPSATANVAAQPEIDLDATVMGSRAAMLTGDETVSVRRPAAFSSGDNVAAPAFCNKCGNKRVGDAAFCTKCGNPFPVSHVQPVNYTPQAYTQVPNTLPQVQSQDNPPKKLALALRVALASVISLCVLGLGVFSGVFIYNNYITNDVIVRSEDDSNTDDNSGFSSHRVANFTGTALNEDWVNEYEFLDFEFVAEHSEHPANMVFYQSIEQGEDVADGTAITLKYSLGADSIVLPDYDRFHSESYRNLLINMGVNPSSIEIVDKENTGLSDGMVVDCNYHRGDTIQLEQPIIISRAASPAQDDSISKEMAIAAISEVLPRYYKNYLDGINFQSSDILTDVTPRQYEYLEERIFNSIHEGYYFEYDKIVLDLDSVELFTADDGQRVRFSASFHFIQSKQDSNEVESNQNIQVVEMVYGFGDWLIDSAEMKRDVEIGRNQMDLFVEHYFSLVMLPG